MTQTLAQSLPCRTLTVVVIEGLKPELCEVRVLSSCSDHFRAFVYQIQLQVDRRNGDQNSQPLVL